MSYLIIVFLLMSLHSEGLPGGISVGIQISQTQAELAVHPTLPELCFTGLVLPSPASNGGTLWNFKTLKWVFKASGSPVWGGSGELKGS